MNIRPKLVLDFGTANCVILDSNENVLLNEPTTVAIDIKTNKVLAVGSKAQMIFGKEPGNISAVRPLKNGGVSNLKLANVLLHEFLKKSLGRNKIFSPDVIISVPSKINSLEERALVKILKNYGVNKITLVPESYAAGLGADLPIEKSIASMIVNIGGGTSEVAIFSMKGIIMADSGMNAGDDLNTEIVNFIRKEFDVLVGDVTAEKLKIDLGSLFKNSESTIIIGKSTVNKNPKEIRISSEDLLNPIREVVNKMCSTIEEVFDKVNPEVFKDLGSNGIALSGGSSQLTDLDKYFTKYFNIPFYVVEEPLLAVAKGLRRSLNLKVN